VLSPTGGDGQKKKRGLFKSLGLRLWRMTACWHDPAGAEHNVCLDCCLIVAALYVVLLLQDATVLRCCVA